MYSGPDSQQQLKLVQRSFEVTMEPKTPNFKESFNIKESCEDHLKQHNIRNGSILLHHNNK